MHLDLSFNRIKDIDLTPLEHCKLLTALHLYENKLTSIDLSVLKNCRKLRNLSLSKNGLDTLDISALFNCPNLRKPDLDSDVSLIAATKLKKISKIPSALKPLLSKISWY
jgi:Leucine-rich repeat (LRR) protein